MLALVPVSNAPSDCTDSSDNERELLSPAQSSSPAPSIASSLENLNISESDTDENVYLTPIIQDVCPEFDHELNLNQIPILSELPSLTATPASECMPLQSPASLPVNSSAPATPATPATSLNLSEFISPITPRVLKRKTKSRPQETRYVVPPKRTRKIPKFTLVYKWQKARFRHLAIIEEDEDWTDIPKVKSPLDYFSKFFSPDIRTDIVEQTNLYSVRSTGKSINVTEEEIRDFLAIEIIMGVVKMPSYLDYWSQRLRYDVVADFMTLKRYQQIRRNLHFVDNTSEDTDRYFKVRLLIEKVRQNCLKHEDEQTFSVDEMMIPYKGTKAGKRRQFMKDKPTKWGFKNYARAGMSGMIFDFIMYGGEDTFRFHKFTEKEATLGFGAQVVLALCQSIKKKPAFLYCDNYFTSPELFYILREDYGIFGCGTIRSNRLRGADNILPSEKLMKKKPRGTYAQAVCNKTRLAAVRWHDNKTVTLISSYVGAEPVGKIKRYCKEARGKRDVDCPHIVKLYNKHMGGVDLADMLIALYRTPYKSRKWYLAIFVQMIDICMNNAWLLYRKDCKRNNMKTTMPLKAFRFEVSEGLKKTARSQSIGNLKKKKKQTLAQPIEEIRYDNTGHFLNFTTQGRCRLCSKFTTVICMKCNVRLCFVAGKNNRNCHLEYHVKK